jgi:polysaccharide export outer membrane protein
MTMTANIPGRGLAVVLLALTACAAPTGPSIEELEAHATEVSQEYVLGSQDTLQITVWQQPSLSLNSVVVRMDGKISFPLLDDVQAAGLTTLELKGSLTEGLAEYITAPHVTVILTQSRSKLVYVIGEVNKPGALLVTDGMRVASALSQAGGFRTFADQKRVRVIRNMNGSGPVEFIFNYPSFADGDNLAQNILLLPGDNIVVPEQSSFWQ